MASQLEAFSANAIEHLRRERGLLLEGEGVPSVSTPIEGRQVLVVLRAFDYAKRPAGAQDLHPREHAGADRRRRRRGRAPRGRTPPDLVVTDADEISEKALRCGAEVVAHAGSDGRVRGVDRLERLGVTHAVFATGGTAEDAAILLAHAHDARLIVMVGSHATLVEFLDKGRSGMASSFLTRAAVGSTVVDAKAVARLYRAPGPRLASCCSCSSSASPPWPRPSRPPRSDRTGGTRSSGWCDDLTSWLKGLFS